MGILTKRLSAINNEIKNDEFYKCRLLFIFESCAGTTLYNMTTGAFMAGLAAALGASDKLNGLLAVIPMAAGLAQIFAPMILERLPKRKSVIVTFMGIYKLLISLVVFIPLLLADASLRLIFLFGAVTIAYSSLNIVFPGFASWIRDVVPDNEKGKYFGIKDSYALATTTIVTLVMGIVLDSFKKPGAASPDYAGFLAVFGVAFVLAILNIFIMIKTKEPVISTVGAKLKFSECFIKPIQNKVYMKVVLFFMLWNVGLNIGVPFLSVYQVKYLQLEYKYIMLLNLLNNLVYIVAARLWGRYADRFSWLHSAAISIGVLSLTHFIWVFITAKTLFLLPIVFILGGIAWGGINISLFNLPFIFIPNENKTIYLGFNAAIGGIFGLLATLIGGEIVTRLNGKSFSMAFLNISNIQLVLFMSSVILFTCSLFAAGKLKKLLPADKEE